MPLSCIHTTPPSRMSASWLSPSSTWSINSAMLGHPFFVSSRFFGGEKNRSSGGSCVALREMGQNLDSTGSNVGHDRTLAIRYRSLLKPVQRMRFKEGAPKRQLRGHPQLVV